MSRFRLTLPASVAAHLAVIALLFLLPAPITVPQPPLDLSHAVSVVFAPASAPPAPAKPEPAAPQLVQPPAPPQRQVVEPPPAEPAPPLAVVQPPPPPQPQVVEQPPPPPAPVAEVPAPPPPKPQPPPLLKPRPRPQMAQPAQPAREEPTQQMLLPLPTQAAPQMASIPSAPAPTISADYRTLLSGWLESHKRYPEEARQRGEQGRAVLRFRVDRYGRVLDYAVVSSTGFADLDRAVENMMRGANMPPFPPSMTEPEIEVSVTIRFGLSR